MAALAGIVTPVFALILMGAAAARLRLVDLPALRGLNDFAFFLAIPALLFGSVAEAPSLHLADVAGLYFAAALAIYVLGLLAARLWLGAGAADAAVVGLNASYGNTVMLGLPVVSAAYGAEGVAVMLGIIALHSAVLLPLAAVLVEAGGSRGGGGWRSLRRTIPALLRNPVILSMLAAFAWRVPGLAVPDALHRLLALLGGAAPPLALFCLGASLPGFGLGAALREVAFATGLKLAALPGLVAALGWWAGLRGLPFAVMVVTAGMPTGANAFLLARRMDTMAAGSASTVVVSTALSLLTLSALLAWLG